MTHRVTLLPLVLLAASVATAGPLHGQEITVDAGQVRGCVSRYLTGACIEDVNHEIYGGIYSQMIFGESFQEPPLPPDIVGFKRYGGRWLVDGGVVRIDGGAGPRLASDRAPFADGVVGVEVKFADRRGGNAGLVVPVDQPGIGADRFIGYEIALDAARQRLVFARHRNNFEPIKDVPCAVAVGRWIPLAVKLAGSVIDISVDGKSVLRHDDGRQALPAGRVGLRTWQREASYRALWVKTGDEVESLAFRPASARTDVSGMWRPIRRGTAQGRFALSVKCPFAGAQSQQMEFISGQGEWGIANQGLNRWGMNFVAGRPYEGYLWVRAEKPVIVVAALESRDGSRRYAETKLPVTKRDWQRIDFTLRPSAADMAGRSAVTLRSPARSTSATRSCNPAPGAASRGYRCGAMWPRG